MKRANEFSVSTFYPEIERKGLYLRRTADGEFVSN